MLVYLCTLTDLLPMSKCMFKVSIRNTRTRFMDAVVASSLFTLNIYFSDGIFDDAIVTCVNIKESFLRVFRLIKT